jgi:hypothetical protein
VTQELMRRVENPGVIEEAPAPIPEVTA